MPIRSAQIVSLALAAGIGAFAIVIAVLQQSGSLTPSAGPRGGLYIVVAGAMWGLSALSGTLVLRSMLESTRRSREWAAVASEERERSLTRAFATRSIMWAALMEGPGLFGVVALMLTGSAVALIPTLLSIAGIIVRFPSDAKFERFANEVTRPNTPALGRADDVFRERPLQ